MGAVRAGEGIVDGRASWATVCAGGGVRGRRRSYVRAGPLGLTAPSISSIWIDSQVRAIGRAEDPPSTSTPSPRRNRRVFSGGSIAMTRSSGNESAQVIIDPSYRTAAKPTVLAGSACDELLTQDVSVAGVLSKLA